MPRFSTVQTAQGPQAVPALESGLLGELTHRTVNDLYCASAALRLAGRELPSADPRRILTRLAARLEALGALQRLLQAPPCGGEADLADQLTALCQAMVDARYAEQGIELRLRIEVDGETLEVGVVWRILMVVTELLVNAARHAFDRGGTVRLNLSERPGAIVCRIQDDGCGRPLAKGPGYGSRVVAMLVDELRGELRTTSSSAGTEIELIVPRYGSLL